MRDFTTGHLRSEKMLDLHGDDFGGGREHLFRVNTDHLLSLAHRGAKSIFV